VNVELGPPAPAMTKSGRKHPCFPVPQGLPSAGIADPGIDEWRVFECQFPKAIPIPIPREAAGGSTVNTNPSRHKSHRPVIIRYSIQQHLMQSLNRISFDVIWQELTRILLSLGFEKSRAKRCAYIFTENTCDGVFSHGLNRFPSFVSDIRKGIIEVGVVPDLVKSFGAIEQWDGRRGVGPLNAEKAMGRAIELSRAHGLGCVGLRNTNHWMRGGTYGLQAAGAECIGICWTNTIALMPPWGSSEKKIGNNPMVVCVPHGEEPVLLDMAMSQFSNGKLEVLRRRGEQLPLAGGYDEKGELTKDPHAILESFRALPIGYWKGSGLALVLDLLSSLVSGGDSTSEISKRQEETGVSQVFMAIDIVSRMGEADSARKIDEILRDFRDTTPIEETSKVRFPGQGMIATRRENLSKGIPVDRDLWKEIREL